MIADLGVDMLAAGIGNIHGKYPANWKGLNFDVLAEIQKLTGTMPLVLHGGTGIPADMIKEAISLGVSKINVNTECQLSFADATRKYIEAGTVSSRFRVRTHLESTGKMWYTVFSEKNFSGMLYKMHRIPKRRSRGS